jgi:hypothetical protein
VLHTNGYIVFCYLYCNCFGLFDAALLRQSHQLLKIFYLLSTRSDGKFVFNLFYCSYLTADMRKMTYRTIDGELYTSSTLITYGYKIAMFKFYVEVA